MTLPDTTEAREAVLARVRAALSAKGTHHARTDSPESGPSGIRPPETLAEVLDLFVERVADYRATVTRCAAGDLTAALAVALRDIESVVVPTGFDKVGLPKGIRVIAEADVTAGRELDGVASVVTTAAVGIAVTGTIVLDHGPGQGARALSLVPDLHVCIVRSSQVVATVPEAVATLRPSIASGRALTWISGPSATSDIELDRVEGVHGPRTLHVVLVDD